ncbi:MAG: ArsC family reductase [Thermoflexibacteraceae bacterium]
MYKIYGIANCDTMKKAMTWLKENDIPFEFHNYKKDGLTKEKVAEWLTQKPWDVLVNRAGTTWKKLSDEEKATDAQTATALMLEKTSIIKRPIIEADNIVVMGFNADTYQEIFK